ncbi:hypothetical protein BSKO_02182 [Bryopsis sp. KO-2023]|nr:hypothetical protein BSKO_02182 [Bryopsis sp. KO-2023]
MDAFSTRMNALEGAYFKGEEAMAMERHVERLVKEGKIPSSVLNSLRAPSTSSPGIYSASGIPTEVRGRPQGEFIYRHKKGALPVPNLPNIKDWSLGTSMSMGRSRWMVDNVSIFDVSEGRKMAATPRRQPTMFEIKRAEAVQKAAMETPLVGKYRWLPEFTPGRAMFWGTIAAFAGTAIGSKIACVVLDIKQVDDILPKMKSSLSPLADAATGVFQPLGVAMTTAGTDSMAKSNTKIGEFADKIRQNMQ